MVLAMIESALSSNPKEAQFVAGGTVPPGSPSYVERAADRELYQALRAGDYCFVLNSRQMGKSSLAVRMIGKLEEASVKTAFVDLTKLGGSNVTPEQWYAGLLVETGRALGLRTEAATWLREQREFGPAQRYLSFLQELVLSKWEGAVVVMIDEIDAVRSLPFSTDELFAGVRQLYNGRATNPDLNRLTFCLLGAALPWDLIKDERNTPFNIGKRVYLRDFTLEEAVPLSTILGKKGDLNRVMYWTHGHPFLTQALCAELANQPGSNIDRLVMERYFDARSRETDTNLSDVGRRLLGDGTEEERANTLSLYSQMLKRGIPDDESNKSAARIKMSGVARSENGRLVVRNRIYQRTFNKKWVAENMPGQELRRQRAAFMMGALRVGVISGLMLLTIASLAASALSSANKARIAEKQANQDKDRALAAEQQMQQALRRAVVAESAAKKSAKEALDGKVLAQKLASDRERALSDAKTETTRAVTAEKDARDSAQRAQTAATVARDEKNAAEKSAHAEAVARADSQNLLYTSNVQLGLDDYDRLSGTELKSLLSEARQASGGSAQGWEWDYLSTKLGQPSLLKGHWGDVMAVAFSPDGYVLTLDRVKTLRAWDPDHGKVVRTFKGSNYKNASAFALSKTGKWIAIGTKSGRLDFLDTTTFTVARSMQFKAAQIDSISWQDACGQLFVNQSGITHVVQGELGAGPIACTSRANSGSDLNFKEVGDAPLIDPGQSTNVFTRFNGSFGTCDDLGHLIVVNSFATRVETFKDPFVSRTIKPLGGTYADGDEVRALAVSPARAEMVFSNTHGQAFVADSETGVIDTSFRIEHLAPILALTYSQDGNFIASGSVDGSISVWSRAEKQRVASIKAQDEITVIGFSPDGMKLAYGTVDGTAGVCDLRDYTKDYGIPEHLGGPIAVTSPDGRILATAGREAQEIRLWDTNTLTPIACLASDVGVFDLAFTSDGKYLAACGSRALSPTAHVQIWDTSTLKTVRMIDLGDVPNWGNLTFSPDGKTVFVGKGSNFWTSRLVPSPVNAYDVASGRKIATLNRAECFVTQLQCDLRSGILTESSQEGIVRQFRLKDNKFIKAFPNGVPLNEASSFAYLDNGTVIAVGTGTGEIALISTESGNRIGVLRGHTDRVTSIGVSPDGQTLISCSTDETIRFWNLRNRRPEGIVYGSSPFYSLVVSKDGRSVFAGQENGHIEALSLHNTGTTFITPDGAGSDNMLASTVAQAEKENKPILTYICDDQGLLTAYVRDIFNRLPSAPILHKYFVVKELNYTKDPRWRNWMSSFGNETFGYPQIFIFDPHGKLMVTGSADAESSHQGENIGAPGDEWEIAYFIRMLHDAQPKIPQADLDEIHAVVQERAKPLNQALARSSQPSKDPAFGVQVDKKGADIDARAAVYQRWQEAEPNNVDPVRGLGTAATIKALYDNDSREFEEAAQDVEDLVGSNYSVPEASILALDYKLAGKDADAARIYEQRAEDMLGPLTIEPETLSWERLEEDAVLSGFDPYVDPTYKALIAMRVDQPSASWRRDLVAGCIYYRQGKLDLAKGKLELGISHGADTVHDNLLIALGRLFYAMCEVKQGQRREAKSQIDQAHAELQKWLADNQQALWTTLTLRQLTLSILVEEREAEAVIAK